MFIDAKDLKDLLENINPESEYAKDMKWYLEMQAEKADELIRQQEEQIRKKEEFDLQLVNDIRSVLMDKRYVKATLLDIWKGLVEIDSNYSTVSLQAITRLAYCLVLGRYTTHRRDENGNKIRIPLNYEDDFRIYSCKVRCSNGVKQRKVVGYIATTSIPDYDY